MNNKTDQGYHISKGANDVYWILNDGNYFIQNLSLELEEAKLKAKQIVGEEVPVSIWHRKKHSTWIDYPKQQDDHIKTHFSYLHKIEFDALKSDCDARNYVGEIGKELIIELTLLHRSCFETQWGISFAFKFKDSNNNRFIYFGTSNKILDAFKNVGDAHTVQSLVKKQYLNEYLDRLSVVPYKINQITKLKIINKTKEVA